MNWGYPNHNLPEDNADDENRTQVRSYKDDAHITTFMCSLTALGAMGWMGFLSILFTATTINELICTSNLNSNSTCDALFPNATASQLATVNDLANNVVNTSTQAGYIFFFMSCIILPYAFSAIKILSDRYQISQTGEHTRLFNTEQSHMRYDQIRTDDSIELRALDR